MDLLELKAEMVLRRVRQRQVAVRLGISESQFSDMLNGYRAVDSDLKRRIREIIDELSAGKLRSVGNS